MREKLLSLAQIMAQVNGEPMPPDPVDEKAEAEKEREKRRKRIKAKLRAHKADYRARRREWRNGPKCGAMTRAGTPCQRLPEFGSTRCRLHGGLSTGPKTPEGKAKVLEAMRKGKEAKRKQRKAGE